MNRFTRSLVLGMDGLDPKIVTALIQRNQLPNFARLADRGTFTTLQTSNPAMSPVAWTDIATGADSGTHGIFDFLHRDPQTYIPYISIRKSTNGILGTRYERARACHAFWDYTTEAGIPTSVIRWPVTFPAEKVNGRFLSGLGTPDLLGTEGQYTYYTTVPISKSDPSPHNVVQVCWDQKQTILTVIEGPVNSRGKPVELPLRLVRQSDKTVLLKVADRQPIEIVPSRWTPWIRLSFKVGFGRVRGMVRFLLTASDPDLKLYCTPINLDPANPSIDFTYPPSFAQELQQRISRFHSLGMPLSVHPLSHGRFNYDRFLDQAESVATERQQMFAEELDRFDEGLLAFVFDHTDRIQHAFWSMHESKHTSHSEQYARGYGQVINDVYRQMDDRLGEAINRIDDKTLLLVVSDHGFGPFSRQVHINRWLIENGYMVLQNAGKGRGLFQDVDWSRTKAYATGFSSIYLNLVGREGRGIVREGDESQHLCKEIMAGLFTLTDSKKAQRVVKNAYLGRELYNRGPLSKQAPDIVCGLNPGYRFSWQTALGGAPLDLTESNTSCWTGDHIFDPTFMPGILLSNVKLPRVRANSIDIAPTLLYALGLTLPSHMHGRCLWES